VIPNAVDLPGRFVSKGQLVGYVVESQTVTARVALGQDEIAQVRNYTKGVEVMPADWGARPVPAAIVREVPGASAELPTAALGSGGGGLFAVDPLGLPAHAFAQNLGARVYVRFDHGYEPVGFQAYRALRRLLLRQFDV
jgi:putative peptide zinc metalloprotease protein